MFNFCGDGGGGQGRWLCCGRIDREQAASWNGAPSQIFAHVLSFCQKLVSESNRNNSSLVLLIIRPWIRSQDSEFVYKFGRTCDIFSRHVVSSFMMVCALSLASLSAPSRRSLCSFSVRASQRRFDRCILARVKSSSDISMELSTVLSRSSDFDPRECVASLTSRNRVLSMSNVFRLSSWAWSFTSSSSWDLWSTDCYRRCGNRDISNTQTRLKNECSQGYMIYSVHGIV